MLWFLVVARRGRRRGRETCQGVLSLSIGRFLGAGVLFDRMYFFMDMV